ncbi:MAG: hypothetical protein V4792_02595 [Pseudomonadota bacterium]
MRRALFLALSLGALFGPPVSAQSFADTNEFNGRWNVSIQSGTSRPHAAKLVLTDFDGTWQDLGARAAARAKVCRGKKFPVTVQVSQATQLEFMAWGSSVSPACPDISLTVRPVSPKVLEGRTATGEPVRLTRQ